MTSPHSSISNSEARRYLRVFGVGSIILLGLLASICAASYRFGLIDIATRWVYDYQRTKVVKADEIKIVFVGDSSLGNAIDANLFGKLTEKSTANLALSGTHGLGASFNMIRLTNEHHDLKIAVVMQALKTMTRSDAVAGYFFTTDRLEWREMSLVEIAKLYLNYRTVKETFQQVWKRGFRRVPPVLSDDYLAQRGTTERIERELEELDRELEDDPLLPGMVSQAQIDFVIRIAEYCESEGIRCVYAHGPIYDRYCETAAPYIESLNVAITQAGLDVVEGTPRCMPPHEVGDTLDHAAPGEKAAYTRWYHERLLPYFDSAG
jgi:hypothetical protein